MLIYLRFGCVARLFSSANNLWVRRRPKRGAAARHLSGPILSAIKLINYAFAFVGTRIHADRQVLDMVCDDRPKVEAFRESGLVIRKQWYPIVIGFAKDPDLTISGSAAEQARALNYNAGTITEVNPAQP
jgi:hypothetical protein